MPKTKLQTKVERISDPCKTFRVILKSKMYDEEHRKVFTNNDIAEWTGQSPQSVSEKMSGKRDFPFRDVRVIAEKVGFTDDEKARCI